jgi:hypothetical protein
MMIGTASIGRSGLSTASGVFLAFQLEPSALGRLASYGRKSRMMVYVENVAPPGPLLVLETEPADTMLFHHTIASL